jgi:hypothetical protein
VVVAVLLVVVGPAGPTTTNRDAGLVYKNSLMFTSNSVTELQFWLNKLFIFTYLQTADFKSPTLCHILIKYGETFKTHDVYESVHRDTIMKVTNKIQVYRLIYYFQSALYVSGDVFAHHQEHVTVFTVSGS